MFRLVQVVNGYDLQLFEIENSTQNKLGKDHAHVSVFLWCFTEMGCIRQFPRPHTYRLGPILSSSKQKMRSSTIFDLAYLEKNWEFFMKFGAIVD